MGGGMGGGMGGMGGTHGAMAPVDAGPPPVDPAIVAAADPAEQARIRGEYVKRTNAQIRGVVPLADATGDVGKLCDVDERFALAVGAADRRRIAGNALADLELLTILVRDRHNAWRLRMRLDLHRRAWRKRPHTDRRIALHDTSDDDTDQDGHDCEKSPDGNLGPANRTTQAQPAGRE